MGDLYVYDIEDEVTHTDETILRDVRALLKSGIREGPLIDYKTDVSEKDNWPESVAAFANSFGGLIIFGVTGQGGQPRLLTGFDPRNVEIKARLANMILSRIRPRPDFAIRVVTLDTDASKEVAILRVAEGQMPPYVHSKGDEHRIYLRISARKTEADYLQLSSLLDKRDKIASRALSSPASLFDNSQLNVADPPASNHISPETCRFIVAPVNLPAGPRLNFETEDAFRKCIGDLIRPQRTWPMIRSRNATLFRIGAGPYTEHRFGIAAGGGIGFVSPPCIEINEEKYFVPEHFCRHLLYFLGVSLLFYERAMKFYGPCLLHVNLTTVAEAKLFAGNPSDTRGQSLGGSDLFDPPLEKMPGLNMGTQIEIALQPPMADRLQNYVESVLLDLVRPIGYVLAPQFKTAAAVLVNDFLKCLLAVRAD
jgi:hypothetical protein